MEGLYARITIYHLAEPKPNILWLVACIWRYIYIKLGENSDDVNCECEWRHPTTLLARRSHCNLIIKHIKKRKKNAVIHKEYPEPLHQSMKGVFWFPKPAEWALNLLSLSFSVKLPTVRSRSPQYIFTFTLRRNVSNCIQFDFTCMLVLEAISLGSFNVPLWSVPLSAVCSNSRGTQARELLVRECLHRRLHFYKNKPSSFWDTTFGSLRKRFSFQLFWLRDSEVI